MATTVDAFPWLQPGWTPAQPRVNVPYPTVIPSTTPSREYRLRAPTHDPAPERNYLRNKPFPGNMAKRINQFIASTHPNAPLAGKGAMLVRAASKYGVDPRVLAIIARKESEFGTTSGRFKNNAWGWGVHLGADVNTAPSWEVMAERVAKGLAGSLYKGSGLTTVGQVIPKYAPPSENNTQQYIEQISNWYRVMGGDPKANIFGKARAGQAAAGAVDPGIGSVPVSDAGTAAPTTPDAAAPMAPIMITPGRVSLNPGSLRQIEQWRALTEQQMMQGRELTNVDKLLPRLKFDVTAPVWSGGMASTTGGDVSPVPGGPASASSPRGASSPAAPPAPGGEWGGTYKPATAMRDIGLKYGLSVSSEKRNRQSTASGGVSDHWSGSKDSYAYDLAWGSDQPVAKADQAASEIVRRLGGPKDWGKRGGNFVKTVNGIRWQVIYRSNVGGNHYNHIHVGAKRV